MTYNLPQRIYFHEILQYGLVSTFDLRCEEKKCRPMLTLSDGHGRRINSVKFLERDDQIVTSSNDKNIRIWDLRNKKLINKIQVCQNTRSDREFKGLALRSLSTFALTTRPCRPLTSKSI